MPYRSHLACVLNAPSQSSTFIEFECIAQSLSGVHCEILERLHHFLKPSFSRLHGINRKQTSNSEVICVSREALTKKCLHRFITCIINDSCQYIELRKWYYILVSLYFQDCIWANHCFIVRFAEIDERY